MRLTYLSLILIVLLVVEAVVVQPSCMGYEFRLLKGLQGQHMKRFSIFLALPSATLRVMGSRKMQIDDDDKSDIDDDELDVAPAAGEAKEEGEGPEEGKKQKNVRMAEELGATDDEVERPQIRESSKRVGRGSGRQGESTKKTKPPKSVWELWWKSVDKAMFGWLRSNCKINGKKLLSSNQVLWRFMVPLILWVMAVAVVFGVSFGQLKGQKGPLASLNTMAHVIYRSSRVRLFANALAMSTDVSENTLYRGKLKEELAILQVEYATLLYGGEMKTLAPVSFDTTAPASVFENEKISEIFFKTKDCLRADKSACFPANSPYHAVTHQGLDTLMLCFMAEARAFSIVPDSLAFANHTSYVFIEKVAAYDLWDGLDGAATLFNDYTLQQFNTVKQLHIIMLVVTLALMLAFVVIQYRPYVAQVREECKMIAGMLSHLPAEVDILSQVKLVVLGIKKEDPRPASLALGPGPGGIPPGGMPGMMIHHAGHVGAAMMGPGSAGMMGYYGSPGYASAGPNMGMGMAV